MNSMGESQNHNMSEEQFSERYVKYGKMYGKFIQNKQFYKFF